jgi:hypothetical protein
VENTKDLARKFVANALDNKQLPSFLSASARDVFEFRLECFLDDVSCDIDELVLDAHQEGKEEGERGFERELETEIGDARAAFDTERKELEARIWELEKALLASTDAHNSSNNSTD